jgi:hypothetical protein
MSEFASRDHDKQRYIGDTSSPGRWLISVARILAIRARHSGLLALHHASVIVTWTLNLDFQGRDIITNDLIATLAMPIIAAFHALCIAFGHANPPPIALTPNQALDLERIKLMAAVDAPLRVCAVFGTGGLVLLGIANLRATQVRAHSVGIVILWTHHAGVFCNLHRLLGNYQVGPDFYVWALIMVPIVGYIAVALPLTLLLVIIGSFLRRVGLRRWRVLTDSSKGRLSWPHFPIILIFLLSVVLTSWVISACIRPSKGVIQGSNSAYWLSMILWPESGSSLADLDLSVSLGIGVIAFSFSVWDAVKSRRG